MRGSFNWRDFYAKRVRRILPNLILLLVFVAAVGWFLLATDEYENLGRHIYRCAAFVQNFGSSDFLGKGQFVGPSAEGGNSFSLRDSHCSIFNYQNRA